MASMVQLGRVVWLVCLAAMVLSVPVGLLVRRVKMERAARLELRRLLARRAPPVSPAQRAFPDPPDPPGRSERRAMRE